jgi:hypothetical protein
MRLAGREPLTPRDANSGPNDMFYVARPAGFFKKIPEARSLLGKNRSLQLFKKPAMVRRFSKRMF